MAYSKRSSPRKCSCGEQGCVTVQGRGTQVFSYQYKVDRNLHTYHQMNESKMKSLGVTIGLTFFLEPGFLAIANQDVRE